MKHGSKSKVAALYPTAEPPADLSAESRAWWIELHKTWRFSPTEELILATACRCFDEVRRLERRLRRFGPTIPDRYGGVKSRPEVDDLKNKRRTFLELLDRLKVDEPRREAIPDTVPKWRK